MIYTYKNVTIKTSPESPISYIFKEKKKVNPLVGFGLFIISIILSIIFIPIGMVYTFWYLVLFKRKEFGDYYMSSAKSIDVSGNVLLQYPLNHIFVKRKVGYKYGDPIETISSATGKNKKYNVQTWTSKILSGILDFIDPNHVLDSVNYFVERDGNYIKNKKELRDFIDHMSKKYSNIDFEKLTLKD